MQQDQAETIAIQALTFLAEDEDRLARFLVMSGVGPSEMRERIGDGVFLGGVLDFLLGHDPDVIDFAAWADLPPEIIMTARRALPGGDVIE